MATQLRSIDLLAHPCYFKIFLVDRYGRELDINVEVRYTIANLSDFGVISTSSDIVDISVDTKGGLCIWAEDVIRIRIKQDANCIEETIIDITPEDYLSGENKTVVAGYNNAVDDIPANPYNFIRWNKGTGTVAYPFAGTAPTMFSDRAKECTGCEALPEYAANPYLEVCDIYKPVVTTCDETTFYINSEEGIDASEINTLQLDIIDEQYNTIQTDIATVQLNVVSGSTVDLYAEGINPTGLVDSKNYRFVIWDTVTNNAIYISNLWVYFIEDKDLNKLTSYLEYRASQNIYYWDYEGLPNFKNKQRLHLYRMSWNPENQTDSYREDTTGRTNNYFSSPQKYYEIQTYFFDDRAHEATVVLCEHDEIELNKLGYTVKTKHSIEENPREDSHNGSFELYENRFSTINKTC